PEKSINFEQMYFTLQAAKEGLGVALIPYFLVADEIAMGRLCAPLGSMGARIRHYYANQAPGGKFHLAGDLFCDWLVEEGSQTMELGSEMTPGAPSDKGGDKGGKRPPRAATPSSMENSEL